MTLFIKAPLIPYLIRKLHINDPEPLERALNADLGIYYLLVAKSRLGMHRTRGFVREDDFADLVKNLDRRLDSAASERFALISKHGKKVFEQSLHLIAINSEEHTLKQLYTNDEVSESVYRKLLGKLHLQRERSKPPSMTRSIRRNIPIKDIFDALVRWQSPDSPPSYRRHHDRQIAILPRTDDYGAQSHQSPGSDAKRGRRGRLRARDL